MKHIIYRIIWRDDHDNSFNQVALSSKEGLYLPHKSEYITFVGHPSQQPQHPYWHHINTQSEGSLSYLWEIPLHTCMHWGNHIDINTSLFEGINTQTASIPATPQYSKCIHTGNTSIPKLHPYWQQIYTQNTSIFHIVITSIPTLHPYQQHINWPKIHPYRYNINTQDASILASHQFPKCIHIGITSIPKGGATLASTCASSVTPTLLAPFPSNQPLLVAELLSKEKEINIVYLHLKESR